MRRMVLALREEGEDSDHYTGDESKQYRYLRSVKGCEMNYGHPEQSQSQRQYSRPKEYSFESIEIVASDVAGVVSEEGLLDIEVMAVVGSCLGKSIPLLA